MNLGVAVDGSGNAERALEFTLSKIYNKERGDKLKLILVQPRSTALDVLLDPFNTAQISDQYLTSYAKKHIVKHEQRCKELGIEFETCIILSDKDVKEELIERLEEMSISLLVMGSRGLGAVGRLVLGSTSDYLVKNSICPVIVVR
eukprot:TRINITY_DN6077_c0_g1_i1.p1 TRINITY_DN6077_c0_g1~~TRINITY_DN6077_c0_g1_i1.p1  ORF type:complete len:146 (+),score=16.70 TRINITY_DN6077_c0_g1_i1:77-514(+)